MNIRTDITKRVICPVCWKISRVSAKNIYCGECMSEAMTNELIPLNILISSDGEYDFQQVSSSWNEVKTKFKPSYVKTKDLRLSRVLKMREQFLSKKVFVISEPLIDYFRYQTATVTPTSFLSWSLAILLLPIIVPFFILLALHNLLNSDTR